MSAISGFCEKCNKFRKRHCDGNRNTCMSILFDTIEALQQENEQLRAQVARMREVLKQARDAINGYSTCPYCWDCWGVNGHTKECKFYEVLQNIDALIGGKEDV